MALRQAAKLKSLPAAGSDDRVGKLMKEAERLKKEAEARARARMRRR